MEAADDVINKGRARAPKTGRIIEDSRRSKTGIAFGQQLLRHQTATKASVNQHPDDGRAIASASAIHDYKADGAVINRQ